VNGLAERGYDVTILHTGQHEIEFGGLAVEHIHADPHFAESLTEGLGGNSFDLTVAQYGRLRLVADVMAGRTDHFIAIGAAGAITRVRGADSWGRLGSPVLYSEGIRVPDSSTEGEVTAPTLFDRMVQALEHVFEVHDAGGFSATYVGYPNNYGPRQPGPSDWSVIRRALDERSSLVIADAGLRLEQRVAVENAAAAVLLVADSPELAAGRRYSVADELAYTMRQRVEFIANYLGHEFDLVDIPFEHAWPCHPFYRFDRGHSLCPSDHIRAELGYTDVVSTEEGLARMVDWLTANPPEPGGELEQQINDPFDYKREDELIALWRSALHVLGDPPPMRSRVHAYRHPRSPGEAWRPPDVQP